jgi:hypothetical protein
MEGIVKVCFNVDTKAFPDLLPTLHKLAREKGHSLEDEIVLGLGVYVLEQVFGKRHRQRRKLVTNPKA